MKILKLAVLGAIALTFALPSRAAPDHQGRLREMVLDLEETVITFRFEAKPLVEVVSWLTQTTGVNLVVSPLLLADREESDLRVTLNLNRVSARQTLAILSELLDLGLVYRDGVIFVTTPADARGKPVLRIYSIGDLTAKIRDFPGPDLMLRPAGSDFAGVFGGEEEREEAAFADPDVIQDLILEHTGEGTWEDNGVSIRATERHLFIRTYPSVHREVVRLLDLLRGSR